MVSFKRLFPDDYQIMALEGGFCCGESDAEYEAMTLDELRDRIETLKSCLERARTEHSSYSRSINDGSYTSEGQRRYFHSQIERYGKEADDMNRQLEIAESVLARKK
ncbi:MAG: hypothetical protein OHK0017_00430 [Patescibacteria group bacterium]